MSDYRMNLVNKSISVLAGIFVSIVVARYLGVALRGELAFIIQASGMLAIVAGLGINQVFPYYFRRRPTGETYAIFVRIFLVQFAALAIIATVVAVIVDDRSLQYLLLLIVATMIYQQMESVMTAYNIQLKIRINIAISVLRVLAHVAMILWFPVNLFWPVLISSGLWLLAATAYVMNTGGVPRARVGVGAAKAIVAFSWLPMLTSLLVVANYNVDTLMLKWLGTPEDLGNYAVAAGIIVYLWVVPDAIKEVMVSRVVRSDDIRRVIYPLKAAILLGLLSVAAFVSVGHFAVPLLYGQEFAPAYRLSAILSIGVISMIYYKILGVVMLTEGRRFFYFATLAASVLVNIGANLLVIPIYGAEGAAWASVGSYGVTGFAFLIYFCRIKNLSLRRVVIISRSDLRTIRESVMEQRAR